MTRFIAWSWHRLADVVVTWRSRNAMRNYLMTLTARDLRDFGMAPSDAVAEASKPFWRKPGQNDRFRGNADVPVLGRNVRL
jgi:uncharacterized protein YjiS (DUF1127 family)